MGRKLIQRIQTVWTCLCLPGQELRHFNKNQYHHIGVCSISSESHNEQLLTRWTNNDNSILKTQSEDMSTLNLSAVMALQPLVNNNCLSVLVEKLYIEIVIFLEGLSTTNFYQLLLFAFPEAKFVWMALNKANVAICDRDNEVLWDSERIRFWSAVLLWNSAQSRKLSVRGVTPPPPQGQISFLHFYKISKCTKIFLCIFVTQNKL